jgi:TolB-like protein/Tfp pilus assembly protein PilF
MLESVAEFCGNHGKVAHMQSSSPRWPGIIRFGVFEVDVRTGELRKSGTKIRVQEQPFQILVTLLERPDEVVSREELRQKLWPAETFVDFEHGVNSAVARLRDLLGDSADSPRYIETLPRRGYRFIGSVNGGQVARPKRTARPRIPSLAVMPFENIAADAETEYVSDGITETLIHSLAQLSGLRVMARSTVFRYKGRKSDPQDVGRDLNVEAVLTGRVLQRGDVLLVTTELVDVANGWRLWGKQYDRKAEDILSVQDEIAREISERLRLSLSGQEKKRLAKRYTQDTEAYHLYLKGRHCWNKRTAEGIQRGVEFFKRAIEKDPRFALAYAGIADSYYLLYSTGFAALHPEEAFPRAKAAASCALQIDDTLAEAHASMAPLRQNEWDWAGAEREYKRAIELNPSYATAHHWYAFHLMAQGRAGEAIEEAKQALELDPLSIGIHTDVAFILLYAGQPDQAIEQYERTIELDPTFAMAHQGLGRAFLQKGMHDEALRHLERAGQLSGDGVASASALAHAHAVAGNTDQARAILEKMLARSMRAYVPPTSIAMVYVGLGDNEEAFVWLEKAYAIRDDGLLMVKIHPFFEVLHPDPRFQDLLRRMNLA